MSDYIGDFERGWRFEMCKTIQENYMTGFLKILNNPEVSAQLPTIAEWTLEADPLHMAVRENKVKIVKALLGHKVRIDSISKDFKSGRYTALFEAVRSDNKSMARLLLEKGSDVNKKAIDYENHWTLLQEALYKDYHDMIIILLTYGADPIITGRMELLVSGTRIYYEGTTFEWARKMDKLQAFQWLIDQVDSEEPPLANNSVHSHDEDLMNSKSKSTRKSKSKSKKRSKDNKTFEEDEASRDRSIGSSSSSPSFDVSDYVREGEIGRGAFGSVFKYKSIMPENADIAVKEMSLESKSELTQYEKEIKALVKLAYNSNILQYFTHTLHKGRLLIFMELCACDLRHHVHDNRAAFGHKHYLEMLGQIAGGIKFVHKNNIIHRDLKPANILVKLNAAGKCVMKIADFGLACILASSEEARSRSMSAKGTLSYMAPEMVKALMSRTAEVEEHVKGCLYSVDIFSLGIISYWMFVGQTPFNVMEIIAPDFVPDKSIQENFPWKDPIFIHILKLMLQRKAKKRPKISTVDHIFKALNDIVNL